MNILKLLFGKKIKKKESPQSFLEEKFAPIAKYVYHGNLIVSECPIVINMNLYFQIYFIGENSKNIGKMKIAVDDVFEWMGITSKK